MDGKRKDCWCHKINMNKNVIIKDAVRTPSLFSSPTKISVSNFKLIDLFAGIGGIRLGFEEQGVEGVFSGANKSNFID